MTREEKCLLAIAKGYTYDPETGFVTGPSGNVLIRKHILGYQTFKIQLNAKQYEIKSHQFAWYWIHKECVPVIDHINGDKSDNRIENLRSVTQQENMFNTKSKGYSKSTHKNNYQARIWFEGKNIHLGIFNNELEAHNAYLKAKERYHNI